MELGYFLWSRFLGKYRLQVRVCGIYYKRIYKYDPPGERSRNNKVLVCLQKGHRACTLSHGAKPLQLIEPQEHQEREGCNELFDLSTQRRVKLR